MKRVLVVFSLLSVVLILSSFSSALSCSPSSISQTYNQGSIAQSSFQCINSGNSTVNFLTSGENSYFNLSNSFINGGETITTNVFFAANAAAGLHTGLISFSDSTSPIPISFSVTSQSSSTPLCSINIFPTTLTGIKIQQGETKTRTVTLSVPSCFLSPVTIQGVSLQTDEKPIQLGELSVGTLQPGQSVNVPIEINAQNVAIGSYQDTLQFLVYNSSGNNIFVDDTNIGVLVTAGITPITNFSQSQLPSCTVAPSELGLNSTGTFTCSLPNPNFDIETIVDSSYISGITSQKTSTQYIYSFKAKKIGTTDFIAKYKSA